MLQMAAISLENNDRLSNIAPAPARGSRTHSANEDVTRSTMLHTCETCARRKVKCDKVLPKCSSCRKSKLECLYRTHLTRQRKRKLSGDIYEKLELYESILRKHNLLPRDSETPSSEELSQEFASLRLAEPETSKTGRLWSGKGKSRYINSTIWHNLGEDEGNQLSDEDDERDTSLNDVGVFMLDPLTGAFVGLQQDLLLFHPTIVEALVLWKAHTENVEPLCKILHIPTTSKLVEKVSKNPESASSSEECLVFAIYHFAVFSMTESECIASFQQSRATLLRQYQFATQQALVNASFLKTTEFSIIQALILFLLPCRYTYDSHTYWILTGVAVRIAQRMGLHRDGERMGLPPFEVQMGRRIFYQLMPLDGFASQMSGTGMGIMPNTWDTERPLNIDDHQIWPGMTEQPREKKGATEMMFCLSRSCVGKYFAKAGKSMQGPGPPQFKDYSEIEPIIKEAENEVEENFIRYCDILNPLHFLTVSLARAAITAMRLRTRFAKVRSQTASHTELKEMLQLTYSILDTDTAVYSHPNLGKYMWHLKSFFVWGSWDSLIFVLTSLAKSDLLSTAETNSTWNRVENIYNNHGQLLESRDALLLSIGRLTLKAWSTNPPSTKTSEPGFISNIRSLCNPKGPVKSKRGNSPPVSNQNTDLSLSNEAISYSDCASQEVLMSSIVPEIDNDLNFDSIDWIYWDQLVQSNQTQGDEQKDLPFE